MHPIRLPHPVSIRIPGLTLGITFSILLASAQAAPPTDEELAALAKDPKTVAAGETLFKTACATCHMSGAVGNPNLEDKTWVHGSKPGEILASISKGYMDKGMPGFGGMLDATQLSQLTAYLVSKQAAAGGSKTAADSPKAATDSSKAAPTP